MSIGEVAGQFGLATHVLRHWETMGLLSPARETGGRRRYGRSDLYRVAGILLAKEAGLALADIRDILTTADLEKRRKITRRHRDELVRRIEEMRAALNFIEGALACGHEDITECPNYQSLLADRMARTCCEKSNTDQVRTNLSQVRPAAQAVMRTAHATSTRLAARAMP